MSYDQLNRLTGASSSSGPWNTLSLGWVYDPFGDRTSQSISDVQGAISLGVPPAQPVRLVALSPVQVTDWMPAAVPRLISTTS